MKAAYITLFFIDTVILVVLSFLFLKLMDSKAGGATLTEMAVSISMSIVLLAFLLYRYLKLPNSESSG